MRLPAISLWQPWASLWLTPAKPDETRHWAPPREVLGRRIAVHAAKRPFKLDDLEPELIEICGRVFGSSWAQSLPRGAFVGTVVLAAARRIVGEQSAETGDNLACGNWAPGRWAWRAADALTFSTPVPGLGRQGFFSCEETFRDDFTPRSPGTFVPAQGRLL